MLGFWRSSGSGLTSWSLGRFCGHHRRLKQMLQPVGSSSLAEGNSATSAPVSSRPGPLGVGLVNGSCM